MRRTLQVAVSLEPNMAQNILRRAYGEDIEVTLAYGRLIVSGGFADDAIIRARVLGIADGLAYPQRTEILEKLGKHMEFCRKAESGLFSKAAIEIMARGLLEVRHG